MPTQILVFCSCQPCLGLRVEKHRGRGRKKDVIPVGFGFRVGKYRGEKEATLLVLGLRVGKYHGGRKDDILDLGFCPKGRLLRSSTSCELGWNLIAMVEVEENPEGYLRTW